MCAITYISRLQYFKNCYFSSKQALVNTSNMGCVHITGGSCSIENLVQYLIEAYSQENRDAAGSMKLRVYFSLFSPTLCSSVQVTQPEIYR